MKLDIEQSIYGIVGDPLKYPSRRPNEAYLLDGTFAHKLTWSWNLSEVSFMETGESVSEFLRDRGEASIEERIPQIAFGANRDLTNLAWKFANYKPTSGRTISRCALILSGIVHDAAVVACNIGYWGYIYSSLIFHKENVVDRPFLEGANAPVSVLLLDDDQMVAMHESEGVLRPGDVSRPDVSCDVAMWDVESFGRSLTAQMYVLPLPYLSFDEQRPVTFDSVKTGINGLENLNQIEMWTRIIASATQINFREHEKDPYQLVEMLRDVARKHMRYGQGSVDRAQQLYEALRQYIITELALHNPDGTVDVATRNMPTLGNTEAWITSHRLSDLADI